MEPTDFPELPPCCNCGVPPSAGEPYWAVNIHQEIAAEGYIKVLRANLAGLICSRCARPNSSGSVSPDQFLSPLTGDVAQRALRGQN